MDANVTITHTDGQVRGIICTREAAEEFSDSLRGRGLPLVFNEFLRIEHKRGMLLLRAETIAAVDIQFSPEIA
jgi:hypothetical protein